jgi:MATE family multidrug resistance protein
LSSALPTTPQRAGMGPRVIADVRRIAPLAWPVLIGQMAVLAFSTVDTLLVARASAEDLAALAVGSAAYITIFVGLMGVVLAISPIAGQLYGAQRHAEAGHAFHQSVWLAVGLSIVGSMVLLWPDPFLALSQTRPEVEPKVRGYLLALAVALPPALMFTSYRGFNTAISRPKAVMAMQLLALLLKIPLSALLVFGYDTQWLGLPIHIPAMGTVGCGIATAVVMWLQWGVAWAHVRRSSAYQAFGLTRSHIGRPERGSVLAQLKLGVPMGGAILIEVTGFTFMAFFISRLGTTPVAGHQIAVNLVALMFMVPLAWGNATSTLVAQRIGAGDERDASRLGWHGLMTGLAAAALMGALVLSFREEILRLYTHDAAVLAAAMPLLAWLVVFHAADAGQTIAAYVLRAWQVTTAPLVIYAAAIWGVGLGGGYTLAFGHVSGLPAAWSGAPGFWIAGTAGLSFAATGLSVYLWVLLRQKRLERQAQSETPQS